MDNCDEIIVKCKKLLEAYNSGKLGNMKMPEDFSPDFSNLDKELCLFYFTLPMSLNYQRDSYKLWESVYKSFNDLDVRHVFSIELSAKLSETKLRECLGKYKISLQPNKHINTWKTISKTIFDNWGSISNLLDFVDYDFIKLREVIQVQYKKGFPYLSGPKIFNYWCFILQKYCNIKLKNSEFIEIAPDTHIIKCSVILGVITKDEAEFLSRNAISERWRNILIGSGINPIDMHSPLWFWSRNDFKFSL